MRVEIPPGADKVSVTLVDTHGHQGPVASIGVDAMGVDFNARVLMRGGCDLGRREPPDLYDLVDIFLEKGAQLGMFELVE